MKLTIVIFRLHFKVIKYYFKVIKHYGEGKRAGFTKPKLVLILYKNDKHLLARQCLFDESLLSLEHFAQEM